MDSWACVIKRFKIHNLVALKATSKQ